MKRIVLLITLTAFFGLSFLSACGGQKEAEQSEAKVTSEGVKKEAKEALETAEARLAGVYHGSQDTNIQRQPPDKKPSHSVARQLFGQTGFIVN